MKNCGLVSTVLGMLLSFASAVSAKDITVPIWKDADGRPRVAVTFEGGETFDFIVDTGMMTTMFLPELLEALPLGNEGQAGLPPVDVVIGEEVQYRVRAPQLLSNIKISEETVYGVLGSEFLQQYTVGLDLFNGVMVLSDGDGSEVFPDGSFVSAPMYSPFANLWMTDAFVVGEVPVTAFLDTGANKTFINSRVIDAMDADDYEVTSEEKGQARTGSSSVMSETYPVLVRNLALSTRNWKDKAITVVDGIFAQLRMADKKSMLVGSDMLQTGRIIMDYRNERVYFEE